MIGRLNNNNNNNNNNIWMMTGLGSRGLIHHIIVANYLVILYTLISRIS